MSAAVKALDNQTKHLTKSEIAARKDAESAVIPDRDAQLDKPIRGVTGASATYWRSIIRRLDGLSLLDDLDKEQLGIYCQMLARRDKLNHLCEKLLAKACKTDEGAANEEPNAPENTDSLDSLMSKLATLERNIASYADRLGFTPQARVRLAQKRAAVAAENPEGDFFGD